MILTASLLARVVDPETKGSLWVVSLPLFVALIIFGPKKLPELGKNLGKGLKSFKKGIDEASEEFKGEMSDSVVDSEKSSNENLDEHTPNYYYYHVLDPFLAS